jgi:hypothetical protein
MNHLSTYSSQIIYDFLVISDILSLKFTNKHWIIFIKKPYYILNLERVINNINIMLLKREKIYTIVKLFSYIDILNNDLNTCIGCQRFNIDVTHNIYHILEEDPRIADCILFITYCPTCFIIVMNHLSRCKCTILASCMVYDNIYDPYDFLNDHYMDE